MVNNFDIDPLHKQIHAEVFNVPLVNEVYSKKYRYQGEVPVITLDRVANAIYAHEQVELRDELYDAMCARLFVPAGRILAGAGTQNNVTLMNCFVMDTIPDNMEGIARVLKESMLTMQQGGGIGLDFSTLRPNGAALGKQIGSEASGPMPFADMWDAMCKTIMSAGSRRGAMMMVLRCDHPDIEKFIEAKHEPDVLTNFNMSVLITDDFMEAVEKDRMWSLVHKKPHVNIDLKKGIHRAGGGYVYKIISARYLWNKILKSTFEYSEPGVIFIDRINRENNLNYCETISATNPCGEQPLPPYNACDLGCINLSRMVKEPFTDSACVDFELLNKTVAIGVRFLDNVLDVSKYPLPEQKDEILSKRRIGLGITGLADMLIQLGLVYGSHEAIRDVEWIMKRIANEAYKTSALLAKEKGAFPKWDSTQFGNKDCVIANLDPETLSLIEEYGLRNGLLLTIAPTGTTSIWPCGNVSSGLEPVFAHKSVRKVLQQDGSHLEFTTKGYVLQLYEQFLKNLDKVDAFGIDKIQLPEVFVEAHNITVEQHVAMQAACQKWVDASISKTINCSEDITFEVFEGIYMNAYESGLKGCTTYRPSELRGDVLSRPIESGSTSPEEAEVSLPGLEVIKWERPAQLSGQTYKIKWPSIDSAFYITINDDGEHLREIFIASQNTRYSEWTAALTRMISAIWRTTTDSSFITEELQQVRSTHESFSLEGKMFSSLVSYIGWVIEKHQNALECSPEPDDREVLAPGIYVTEISVFETSDDVAEISFSSLNSVIKRAAESLCPECNNLSLVMESGCEICKNCGYSKCG